MKGHNLQVVKLSATVDSPTDRESVMREELLKLPEVNIERIDGWDDFCIACDRLKAAEILVKEQHEAMAKACEAMRGFIGKNWTAKEIPIGVKSLLTVW